MKYFIIFLLLLPTLDAKTYKFSGGKGNTVQLIASKILQVAYNRAKVKIEPVFLQPEESLQASNSAKTDGELARIEQISTIYPNLVIVPVSLITVSAVAFSKNKSLKITKWDDLKDYKITIVKGTKFIEKASISIDKQVVLSFKEAFDDLNSGKTDIIIIPKLSGLKMIFENNYKKIYLVSDSLKSMKLYHFVHKNNVHLIPIITPILESMKENGGLEYWKKAYFKSITKRL